MSGVKANIASTTHPAGAAGRPVANAGQSEPSIDDILASIRQIISDQNRQADQAAEKAAAEVANKAPPAAKVESIIGTVVADHWNSTASASAPSAASTQRPGFVPANVNATDRSSSNPSELEELIQLIGATPPAPRPTQQALWIDPNSKSTSNIKAAVGMSAKVLPAPTRKIAIGRETTKPTVILPSSPLSPGQNPIHPAAMRQEAISEPRLHPSVSPKTVVPQVIKEAIARPLAKAVVANPQPPTSQVSAAQKPMVSNKSALDKLIARKVGMDAGSPPVVDAPVQRIVAPKAVASAHAQQQPPQQAAPIAVQMPITPARPRGSPIAKSADATQKNASNSPAISSQAVNAAVVKSIERLATSMFADRKDEIDGMMAGIVRPMLQDWLEDNLPSLVERIVREEIERVSRGTHQ